MSCNDGFCNSAEVVGECGENVKDSVNTRDTDIKDLRDTSCVLHDIPGRSCINYGHESSMRRVSFPKSDSELVTGYLEPANPWESVSIVKSSNELLEIYNSSCKKHKTEPLKAIVDHLKTMQFPKIARQPCLSLKNNKLTPEICEPIEEILKRVQYDIIDLSECQLNDAAASALFDMIEYYEAANELDISGNTNITSRGLQSCISMIRRSRALQILTIRGIALSELNASNMGKSLNNSFLHTIKLEHCGLTGRPLTSLCNALRKNTTLKELWLAHNDLSMFDAEKLGDLLKSNAYLEFLDISNNNIKDSGVKVIVKALIEQSSGIDNIRKFNEDMRNINKQLENLASEDTTQLLCDSSSCDKNFKSGQTKAANCGRSMLDTLLNLNSKQLIECPNNEADVQDILPKFQPHEVLEEENSLSDDMNSLEDIQQRLVEFQTNDDILVEESLPAEDHAKFNINSTAELLATNNNQYEAVPGKIAGENIELKSKALDVNKNKKLEEIISAGSDSAFESASEGDLFKDIPKNTFKLISPDKEHMVKNDLEDCQNSIETPMFPESRLRSISSDSLSSENSLDASDNTLLDKIITKNDTLTRQKHSDEPLECFRKPKGLQALILWNNNITRESGEYISDLLGVTVSLELLNIGKNILSNDFIAKIKNNLKTNNTVTSLGLQSAHLSCLGIKMLSSTVQFGGNCTLQRIDIRDNNIQIEGLTSLAEALSSNKSITRIDIDDIPKRISENGSDIHIQYSRVLHTIRSFCSRNGNTQDKVGRAGSFKKSGNFIVSRKISLTCPSIRAPMIEPNIKTDHLVVGDIKKKTGARLRSPLPSPPTVSPSSSPVPSPSRSRFQVFRVIENTNSPEDNTNAQPPKFEPKSNPSPKSRFHVTVVTNFASSSNEAGSHHNGDVAAKGVQTTSAKNKVESTDKQNEEQAATKEAAPKSSSDILLSSTTDLQNVKQSSNNDTSKVQNNSTILKEHSYIDVKSETPPPPETRTRKVSWISSATYPTTVDKLLNLFPGNLFSRNTSPDPEKKTDDRELSTQSLVSFRKHSPPSLFPWPKTTGETKFSEIKRLPAETIINTGIQSSFFDVASKQIKGIADFSKQVFRQNIALGDSAASEAKPCCDTIPSDVNLEIKENISPEHAITPNSITLVQAINSSQPGQQESNQSINKMSSQLDKLPEEESSFCINTPANSSLILDSELCDHLVSSDMTGNKL